MTFDKESNLKFLIIRLSSLGDIVLTTKIIRNIKLNFPKSDIFFICNKEYIDVIKLNPNISKIGLYEKNDSLKIQELRNEILDFKPNLTLDLQKNKRSKFLLQNLENISSYDKRRLYKLLLVYTKHIVESKNLPIPDVYTNTIKNIISDFMVDDFGLEFWLNDDIESSEYTPNQRKYEKISKLRFAVAPAAHFKTKRWPKDYYIQLINQLKEYYTNSEFVILGAKSEMELCNEIAISTKSINMAGKASIMESAELINDSDLFIGNDSGLMHIAAARQVPVVVFFGSTVKEFGFIPYKTPNIILEKNLWCRPCSHIGRNFCPLVHFNCMKKITPIFAFNKIIQLINNLYKID